MTRRMRLILGLAAIGAIVVVLARRDREPHKTDRSVPDAVAADPTLEITVLRTFAKQQVAREAAVGDRPLAEAAVLFGELNRVPPELVPADHSPLHGRTEGERLCRQVISYVRRNGRDWPEVGQQAATRLEAELEEELARHGSVRLPDPAGLPKTTELFDQVRTRMTPAQRQALLPGPGPTPPESERKGAGDPFNSAPLPGRKRPKDF